MRWVALIVGIIASLLGIVWGLQGLNVIAMGAMAGHRRWIAIGAVLLVAGIILIIIGARRKKLTKA